MICCKSSVCMETLASSLRDLNFEFSTHIRVSIRSDYAKLSKCSARLKTLIMIT